MSTGLTPPTPPDPLLACLEPADVLLVEGNSIVSTAIKYLTQSTWSHAGLDIGADGGGRPAPRTTSSKQISWGSLRRRRGIRRHAYSNLSARGAQRTRAPRRHDFCDLPPWAPLRPQERD